MSKPGKGWWSESQEDLQQCLPTASILSWDAHKEEWRMQWGGPCSRSTHVLEGEEFQIQACHAPKTSVRRSSVICLEMPLAPPAVTPYAVWRPWNPHGRACGCLEPLLFQLQHSGVIRRITVMVTRSHIFSSFLHFFLFPCPLFQSKISPCAASWQGGHSPACASSPRTSPWHTGGVCLFLPP